MKSTSVRLRCIVGLRDCNICRLGALCAFLLTVLLLRAEERSKLIPFSSSESAKLQSKLDLKALPEGNRNLQVDRKQSFRLIAEGQSELDIIPVKFDTPIPETEGVRENCGVYLLRQNAPMKFFWTLGRDTNLPFNCLSLDALGIQPFENEKPAIILLYTTEDPGPHEAQRWPYVITWDENSKDYVITDGWGRDTGLDPKTTIRDIQRLLGRKK